MPTPPSLLNTLRGVSAFYMMTDSVQILRSESFTDEYGGTYNSYSIVKPDPEKQAGFDKSK